MDAYFGQFSSTFDNYESTILNMEEHFDHLNSQSEDDELNLLPLPSQLDDPSHMLIEETIEVDIGEDPTHPHIVLLGKILTQEEQEQFFNLLKRYIQIFAWTYSDMLGLDLNLVVHNLVLEKDAKPIKQKLRKMHPKVALLVKEELQKLLDVGFITPIDYPTWVSNVVPVGKKIGGIHICTDFCDINKACPKDDFPLPSIDNIVDATIGHEILSLMDGFSGYNQIHIAKSDQHKTAFTTPWGTFCYKVMPFGLKNAGATYQRAMMYIFHDYMGDIVECYVDDLLAKSKTKEDHINVLSKNFDRLLEHKVRLNPKKCVFSVTSGKLLGCIISRRGIEVDLAKIKAITDMPPPQNLKEI